MAIHLPGSPRNHSGVSAEVGCLCLQRLQLLLHLNLLLGCHGNSCHGDFENKENKVTVPFPGFLHLEKILSEQGKGTLADYNTLDVHQITFLIAFIRIRTGQQRKDP